ncbi:MAG: ABC transporter substrate-binding protein, partial [Paracoccaceae bacterium]|nr:ABC transporter substrate-binding protein [Paracoccaceae bacterium]
YTAGFHEPAAGLTLATNLEVFNNLSKEHQSMIEIAAGHANVWNLSQYLFHNGAALNRLQSEGVKVLQFPDSVWDAFGSASMQLYEQYSEDDLFAEVLADYQAVMSDSSSWLTNSTGAYRAQRDRVMG